MTLDLDELTLDWECPPGELRARAVIGRDGSELLQLRIDLGVMQMVYAGRPDGTTYHGLPNARDYIEHELRLGGQALVPADWQELKRELMQLNYRRMAFATLAEDALTASDRTNAERYIAGALGDIHACLEHTDLLARHTSIQLESDVMQPTLVFDQARLLSQLSVVIGQYEQAIEQAEAGADALDTLLAELGYDEDQREEDPGVEYLRDLGHQLRIEYGISQTLHEKLQQAIEDEDFEAAAELRDQMQRRQADPDAPPAEPA
jgi:hypothetical protein